MKNIRGYANTRIELDLVKLNLEKLEKEEKLLKEQKELFLNWQKEIEELLVKMEEKLKELKGIEKELFYEIVVRGTNVTRAVDKVSFTYDLDPSTIWKNYYPKVKIEIKDLGFSSENRVD